MLRRLRESSCTIAMRYNLERLESTYESTICFLRRGSALTAFTQVEKISDFLVGTRNGGVTLDKGSHDISGRLNTEGRGGNHRAGEGLESSLGSR